MRNSSLLNASMILMSILMVACSSKSRLDKSVFDNAIYIKKPIINEECDIQKAYIDLFEAYKKNLNLLECLKETY